MIIYLLDELISKCDLENNEPKFIEVFESLADVRKYGFNFLIGDRKIIELLRKNEKLSSNARSIYSKIYQNYTTEMAINSTCNFRFEIGLNDDISPNCHKINIEQFVLTSFHTFNNLLVENPTDTFLYNEMLNYYKTLKSITNINCEFEPKNGGGSTIHNEYSRITNEKKCFTLCLIDSDKIFPSCELGSTSKKFIDDGISTPWGNFSILEVHEIENLLPKSIYNQYINEKHSLNSTILSSLTFSDDCNLFNYLDLKNGINKKKILELDASGQNFYKEKFNLNTLNLNCSCTKVKECNCFIFHPLGRPILNQIKDFIANKSINIIDHINESLILIYTEVGKTLFNIYCKPLPLVTV